MVRIDADPTDPPAADTSRPFDTLTNWALYIVGLGLFFTALTVAQSTAAPAIGGVLESLGITSNAGGDGPVLEV